MDKIITMDEEILRARNLIVSKLAAETGVIIQLSDELEPETDPPYGYYTFITPYASTGEMGIHTQIREIDSGTGKLYIKAVRSESPSMVLSFNFCSKNRKLPDGTQINGENEAMALAAKAVAYLKHDGATVLSFAELVVVGVNNFSSRSGIIGDEIIRRWGFDLTVRYTANTIRKDGIVENVRILKEKTRSDGNGS